MTGNLQLKNDKWFVVLNTYDENGKRKQKWIPTGYSVGTSKKEKTKNKFEAEKFKEKCIREYEEAELAKKGLFSPETLFSTYVENWLEGIETRVQKITFEGYCSISKNHIVPYFKKGQIRLKDINEDVLQRYVTEKIQSGKSDGTGLSPKSIREHINIIRQTLKKAERNGLIEKNPVEFLDLPKRVKYEPVFLTDTQLVDLLKELQSESLYPIIYTTLYFGLRRSEVLGIKWDSINLEAKTLTIKHTVVRYSKVIEQDSTKTQSSYRSFPLNDYHCDLFRKLKRQEDENRELFGSEYIENEYVFKRDDGKPYTPDYVSRKFSSLLKKHGFEHLRLHDLRHSCASLLLAKGSTMKEVQGWLGHADFITTANIYSHLYPEDKRNMMDRLDASLDAFFDKC